MGVGENHLSRKCVIFFNIKKITELPKNIETNALLKGSEKAKKYREY